MGTRGAYGVIINEQEKIGYGQYDSYPEGSGIENLQWLRIIVSREDWLADVRKKAEACQLVHDDTPPTPEQIKKMSDTHDPFVSGGNDWYALTRLTHGHLGQMLECGYIYDSSTFPLDSLFCEWAYIVDFDKERFEVYKGFQKTLPKAGRWKGRPTEAEQRKWYEDHVAYCKEHDRDPWMTPEQEYKAVELVGSWDFRELPSDEEFLEHFAETTQKGSVDNFSRKESTHVLHRAH